MISFVLHTRESLRLLENWRNKGKELNLILIYIETHAKHKREKSCGFLDEDIALVKIKEENVRTYIAPRSLPPINTSLSCNTHTSIDIIKYLVDMLCRCIPPFSDVCLNFAVFAANGRHRFPSYSYFLIHIHFPYF